MIAIGSRVTVAASWCSGHWLGQTGHVTGRTSYGWMVQLPGETKPLMFGTRELREAEPEEPHVVAGD